MRFSVVVLASAVALASAGMISPKMKSKGHKAHHKKQPATVGSQDGENAAVEVDANGIDPPPEDMTPYIVNPEIGLDTLGDNETETINEQVYLGDTAEPFLGKAVGDHDSWGPNKPLRTDEKIDLYPEPFDGVCEHYCMCSSFKMLQDEYHPLDVETRVVNKDKLPKEFECGDKPGEGNRIFAVKMDPPQEIECFTIHANSEHCDHIKHPRKKWLNAYIGNAGNRLKSKKKHHLRMKAHKKK